MMQELQCTQLRMKPAIAKRVFNAVVKRKKKDKIFSQNKWLNEAIIEKLEKDK